MNFLQIRNWGRFQHYRDGRDPTWLKLYLELQDKWEWMTLPDDTKGHLAGIWMLAPKLKNRIPDDPAFIACKIGASSVDAVARSLELLRDPARGPFIEAYGAIARVPPPEADQPGTDPYQDGPDSLERIDENSEGRVENPPLTPPAGGGRTLSRREVGEATMRLAARWLDAGGVADREWRRRVGTLLRSGVPEAQLAERIGREATERAAQEESRTEAQRWVGARGGGWVVARGLLDWIARTRAPGEAWSGALTRWLADVPPGVLDVIGRELAALRRVGEESPGEALQEPGERAHGPPGGHRGAEA